MDLLKNQNLIKGDWKDIDLTEWKMTEQLQNQFKKTVLLAVYLRSYLWNISPDTIGDYDLFSPVATHGPFC